MQLALAGPPPRARSRPAAPLPQEPLSRRVHMLWVQELCPWLYLADWLFHFPFAPLILFCIPLWGENNPDRTRPSCRTRYLIFSFWIIHKALARLSCEGATSPGFPHTVPSFLKRSALGSHPPPGTAGMVPGLSVYYQKPLYAGSLSASEFLKIKEFINSQRD